MGKALIELTGVAWKLLLLCKAVGDAGAIIGPEAAWR